MDNQMLQKNEQKVMQMQIEDNKVVEEHKEGIQLETVNNEQMNHESIQKNNIQTVRKMEKMNFIEKWKLTSKALKAAGSSEEVQKEQRVSALSKTQRKLIDNKMKKEEEEKNLTFVKEVYRKSIGGSYGYQADGVSKSSSAEDVMKNSYYMFVDAQWRKKKRQDPTGYERRLCAFSNKEKNLASEENMTKDLENLIQNMRLDMIYTLEYKPDERLDNLRDPYICFKNMFEKRDEELGRQLTHLGKKQKDPNYEWPKDLEFPTESRAEIKEIAHDFHEVFYMIKNLCTTAGAQYEAQRMNLRAMEKAKQRLVEDNEFQPSAYTQALILKIDKKIDEQRNTVEDIYNSIRVPGGKLVQERIDKMNATFAELAKYANEIKERRRSLEGLQGEELTKEQEKVKAFEKEIEEKARDIIIGFRY